MARQRSSFGGHPVTVADSFRQLGIDVATERSQVTRLMLGKRLDTATLHFTASHILPPSTTTC